MALDAEIGGIAANSYVTEEEAAEYFADRAFADAWEDIENKDDFLITASHNIDWYVTWKGMRATADQAMGWPRLEVQDDRGEDIPSDIIPLAVKQAVYEYALASLEGDRTADDDLAGLAEVRAGSLMVKTDGQSIYNKPPPAIPESVKKILKGLIRNGGIGVVRLIRA